MILVVEDDRFFGNQIVDQLADRKVSATLVGSVHEALEKSLTEYSGFIVDVALPNDSSKSGISSEEAWGGHMAGIALARKIRKEMGEIPIVIISGQMSTYETAKWARENECTFVSKTSRAEIIRALEISKILPPRAPSAFIVHGRDEDTALELKNYLQNTLEWEEPVILREQSSLGKTIIEKFEDYSAGIDYVFVLLTPDDRAFVPTDSQDEKRRARQNVIFELGFFYGQLSRDSGRILVLKKGDVEIPSDLAGIVWIDISRGVEAAGESIRREVE